MTRAEALATAKQQYAAYQAANIEHLFRNGPEPKNEDYGYRHGWIIVEGFSFNNEELTGQAYDTTQGGWAFI